MLTLLYLTRLFNYLLFIRSLKYSAIVSRQFFFLTWNLLEVH
jgi:hypothetical protein